jgi:hypothetical protein
MKLGLHSWLVLKSFMQKMMSSGRKCGAYRYEVIEGRCAELYCLTANRNHQHSTKYKLLLSFNCAIIGHDSGPASSNREPSSSWSHSSRTSTNRNVRNFVATAVRIIRTVLNGKAPSQTCSAWYPLTVNVENAQLIHVILLSTARGVTRISCITVDYSVVPHGTLGKLLWCWKLYSADNTISQCTMSAIHISLASIFIYPNASLTAHFSSYFIRPEHSPYRHIFQVKHVVIGILNWVPPFPKARPARKADNLTAICEPIV